MNGILLFLLLSSVLTDLHDGKIYNMLVFPALAAGVLQRLSGSMPGGGTSLLVSLAIPAVLLPFYLCGRGLGGGDLKLLLAVSSLMQPEQFLCCFAASFLIAGILALVTLAATRDRKAGIPAALPIAAGTTAVMVWMQSGPGG